MKKVLLLCLMTWGVFCYGKDLKEATEDSRTLSTAQRTEEKRFQPKYEHGPELNLAWGLWYKGDGFRGINADYIGGCRFNEHFFLGAGVGLLAREYDTSKYYDYIDEIYYDFHFNNLDFISSSIDAETFLYFKYYIIKMPVTPVLDFSYGLSKRLSHQLKEIRDPYTDDDYLSDELSLEDVFKSPSFFAKFSVGINIRLSEKAKMYIAIGGKWHREERGGADGPYQTNFYQAIVHSLNTKIAITFN